MHSRHIFAGLALIVIAATGCGGPDGTSIESKDREPEMGQFKTAVLQIDGFMKSESGAT